MNTIFCKDNYFLLIIDCKKSDCFTFKYLNRFSYGPNEVDILRGKHQPEVGL